MSDHADTIRRRLAHRNGVTDPEGAAALDALLAERQQAIDALREIEPQQQRIVEWFRREGVIFDTAPGGDPKSWQHITFTIYTVLCEVDSVARAALVSLGETE